MLDQKETLGILADAGFSMSCNPRKLLQYLSSATPKNRITELRKIGWINDREFICPSFTISIAADHSFSLAGNITDYGFEKKSTLENWQQNVCKPCERNKILTLVLCVGLSGLLLKRLGLSCTIINLVGRSSIGKTTALHAAASLWGNPCRFIQQWRSTSNALESVAESHNDCLLILDELGQVTGKDVGNTVYMLGNSKGKNRLNSDSELKKSREWMLSILSSGEIGIADKISETKDKAKAGQLVRCIDIDCLMSDELGIFDTLHDNVHSSAEFSSHLKKKASESYGTAAEAFVSELIKSNTDLRERFNKLKQKLIADMHLENVDGQVGRVAKKADTLDSSGSRSVAETEGYVEVEVDDLELQKILSEGDVVTCLVANGEEAESHKAEDTGKFEDPTNKSVPYNE